MEYKLKVTLQIQNFPQAIVGYTSPDWVTTDDSKEAEQALEDIQRLLNGTSVFGFDTLSVFDVNDPSIEHIIPRSVLENKVPVVWSIQLLKR